jgi:glycosyltransferase involved in cell wall biosynthesis
MTAGRRRSVLLTTEGTYPFHKGGVSTWCDVLTTQLSDIDFTVLAVTMSPYLSMQYRPAINTRVLPVPLWGTEHPAEFDRASTFTEYLERRWRCLPAAIASSFLAPFERLLRLGIGEGLELSSSGREQLADTLVELHAFFQSHDMTRAFFARPTWDLFEACVRELHRRDAVMQAPVSAADVAEALQLLYRLLLVVSVPIPAADVNHSSAAAFCGLPCVIARRQRGTPYLLTEHGIYVREQYLNLRRVITSPFVRWFMYRLCGAVAAVNYHVADQISPVCGYNARWETWAGADPQRIRVIYNGVDPQRFQPAAAPAQGPPTIVNVGLIYPLKGQLGLIEAAALVRERVPDVRVLLYGSTSDERYYRECRARVAALELQDAVTFAGSTSEPWAAYQQATVVAMSSVSEAFPYAIIEAMLCGAAVVATDTGGVSEALDRAGIVVPPREPRPMADALIDLLRDSGRRAQLGVAARERALRYFTQDHFLQAHRDTYGRMCDPGAAPATTEAGVQAA